MNKALVAAASTILLAGLSLDAMSAPCPGTQLTGAAVSSALSGRRVIAVGPGGEEWNEDHCPGGNLYKVGNPAQPIKDPRALRGTWSQSDDLVVYNYTVTGTSSYSWSLFDTGADHGGGIPVLCWGDPSNSHEEIARTVGTGAIGSCP
jgi:hypothetical protein